jgi:peptidoglycan/xylan/chitin deacetylase (PgdA/CDA1 family)
MKHLLLLAALTLSAQPRQIVLTIDDLPRGGDVTTTDKQAIRAMTAKLVAALKGTHAIGFANPGSEKSDALGGSELQHILKMWRRAGLELGNHTHTHPNINQIPLAEFTADILAAEPALTKALGAKPLYFRHPFLQTGKDPETRAGLANFLTTNHYITAPVTVDNSDYIYARAYSKHPAKAKEIQQAYLQHIEQSVAFFEQRGREVTGSDIPQILLLHANQLNADSLPALLKMLRARGYEFISLQQALRHPAYQLEDGYTGPGGFSWIHRWAKAKGIAGTGKGEPEPSKEIMDLFNKPQ